jgi:hypothetical protein
MFTATQCNHDFVDPSSREWKQCSIVRKFFFLILYPVGYAILLTFAGFYFSSGNPFGALLGIAPYAWMLFQIYQSNQRMKNPDYIDALKRDDSLNFYRKGRGTHPLD